MEPPFFRSYYQTPTPPSHGRAPSRRQFPPQTAPSPPRNVISIPVHFVDSVNKRSNSALKIQKTFRGFRVRKTVKKILELKREVDGVEKKLHERVTMEMIKRDEKERLKINENLMALLFKLDSVRGFNDEVRDSRKRVIKKAIMLQELIDSSIVDNKKESEVIDEEDGGVIEDDFSKMQVEDSEKIAEESETAKNSNEIGDETLENTEDVISEGIDGAKPMQIERNDGGDSGENWECVEEETEEPKSELLGEEDDHGNNADHQSKVESNSVKKASNEEWCVVRGGGGEEKESKERLLEKMVEDNQKLMTMVADLCQKNATQTKLICSLSHRVEQLEKAMSERLRKKKKCNVLHN